LIFKTTGFLGFLTKAGVENTMQYRKIISLIFLFLSLVSCAIAAGQNHEIPLVTLDGGPIIGVIKGESAMFLGIPYASPPIGDLRWRPPEIMPPWEKIGRASCRERVSERV
jgi:hypothetical protein